MTQRRHRRAKVLAPQNDCRSPFRQSKFPALLVESLVWAGSGALGASMRRREFLTIVGSFAVAGDAHAQQTDRVRRVGVVAGASEGAMRPSLNALRGKLSDLGWVDGRNLALDVRLAAGDYQRLAEAVGSLISAGTDVIVAQGSPA